MRTRSTALAVKPPSHLACHIPRLPTLNSALTPSHSYATGFFPHHHLGLLLVLSPAAVVMPVLASGVGSCLPSISTSPFLCQQSIKLAHQCNLPTFLAP